MENRILIKEDNHLFKQIAQDLKQFMPVLNELKSSFEALEIGALTDKDFKQIILLGPTKHMEIYVKNLNNQLDKLGITSSVIRQNAIKDHEAVIERFKKAVNEAKSFYPEIYSANRPKLTIKFISYQDGIFVISKDDKEMILETFCRTYLENEEEIKLYEVSKKLADAFNEYLEIFKTTGIQSINKHYAGSHVLEYDNDTNRMIVSSEGVKGVSSYKTRYEAHILEKNEKSKKRVDFQRN